MKDFNFIFGKSGTGKSTEMLSRVKKEAEIIFNEKRHGFENRIYILVPDQYTLSFEKMYMEELGDRLMTVVRIFSFKRFCDKIITETCGKKDVGISDTGRKILALDAVKQTMGNFSYYPKNYKNVKFTNLISETFSELKGRGISAERFFEIAAEEKNPKLSDIALSYAAYEKSFSGEFFDPDDLYKTAEKFIPEINFSNTHIFIDGFKTFNAKERGIMLKLYEKGAYVTVSALCDGDFSENTSSSYYGVEKNIKMLYDGVKNSGGSINKTCLKTPVRFENKELLFIQKNLFSENGAVYEDVPKNVSIYCAYDLFDEVEAAAAEISELVSKGYKYSDIVVTARDIDTYSGILTPIFEEYEIPVFYHSKVSLKQKSPMTFLLSVIYSAVDKISSDKVLTAYKTGFFGDDVNTVSLLENYCNKWKYLNFTKPFKKSPRGFISEELSEEEKEKDEKTLEKLNALREKFVSAVSLFSDCGKENTVREYCTAVYKIMTFVKMAEKIEKTAEFYKNFEEQTLYAEQERVYDKIISMLDEAVLVSGEKTVTAEDFYDIILSAAEEEALTILPTAIDRVVCGTVATVPFMSQKAVFILGCVEDVFPSVAAEDKLFTDEEISSLKKYEIEIGETLDEKVNYEKFLFTLATSAPKEKLFISYAMKGLENPDLSSFGKEIKDMFFLREKNSPVTVGYSNTENRVINERTAFSLYSKTGNYDLKRLLENTKYGKYIEDGFPEKQKISPETAEALYGKDIYLSASKTDVYSKCPFSYFITYGLSVRKEEAADIDSREFGNFIHKGLEELLDLAVNTDRNIEIAVKEFSKKEKELLLNGDKFSASFDVRYENVMKKLEKLLCLFREEAKNTDFRPVALEKKVGLGDEDMPPVKIPIDGGDVAMVGKVDRIDSFEKNGEKYCRIIDYKTGEKKFNLQKVENGVDMQLPMYLYAITEHEKTVPAGVSYINVNPKTVKLDRKEAEKFTAKDTVVKTPRSGVILNDKTVLSAFDKTLIDSSKKGPQGYNLFTKDQIDGLFERILENLRNIGNGIKSGNIEKSPLNIGKESGCTYCIYSEFCKNKKEERVITEEKAETENDGGEKEENENA